MGKTSPPAKKRLKKLKKAVPWDNSEQKGPNLWKLLLIFLDSSSVFFLKVAVSAWDSAVLLVLGRILYE